MFFLKREIGLIGQLSFFGVLLVLIASTLGPWIISTPLLAKDFFWIYPNLGKIGLLLTILQVIKEFTVLKDITWYSWRTRQLVFLVPLVVFLLSFMYFSRQLLMVIWGDPSYILLIAPHIMLWGIIVSLLGLTMQYKNIALVRRYFGRELMLIVFLTPFLATAIFYVWTLWPYFSGAVLAQLVWLLQIFYDDVRSYSNFVISVEGFAVRIAESCSGIDSLFMYILLMAGIAALEWKRIIWKIFLPVFVVGLLGVYFLNTLRVFLLLVIGVEYSQKLAVTLFHTYAGMILFLGFFFLLMHTTYRKIIRIS